MDELARLRRIATQRAELLEERDRLMVQARTAGKTMTDIAAAAGLSRMQAHRIVHGN